QEFELTLEPSGQLNFYQGNGGSYEEIPFPLAAITAGAWHHVAIVRTVSAPLVRLYVDGQLRGSRAYTTPVAAGPRPITIARSDNGAKFVNGRLDEVALY